MEMSGVVIWQDGKIILTCHINAYVRFYANKTIKATEEFSTCIQQASNI